MTKLRQYSQSLFIGLLPAIALIIGGQTSASAAVIGNGTIALGVNREGNLIDSSNTGIKFLPNGNDGISAGCACEGWGVADAGPGGSSMKAGVDFGIANLVVSTFTSDATTAKSIVVSSDGIFQVTHEYSPSSSKYLYNGKVTIQNLGTASINDLRYRRVMDWDIPPNVFNELVTIQGTASALAVLAATNGGFSDGNPLSSNTDSWFATPLSGDFVDKGPADHGALFDFGFGTLARGASKSFDIFYGAAPTESDAIAALAAVQAEVYSFGQWSGDGPGGTPNTFIFGFKGVGGKPVTDTVPTPALLPGLIGIGAAAYRKRKGAAAAKA
jgi:hypothetical protein